MENSSKLAV